MSQPKAFEHRYWGEFSVSPEREEEHRRSRDLDGSAGEVALDVANLIRDVLSQRVAQADDRKVDFRVSLNIEAFEVEDGYGKSGLPGWTLVRVTGNRGK